jgi:SAM-dependent methyltransferase
MFSTPVGNGVRLCPACASADPIADGAPIWPLEWQCNACGHVVPQAEGIPHFAVLLSNSQTGFDADAFARLAPAEAGHFWFEPRNRLLAGLADCFFPDARRYLEIGCGTGFVLARIASARTWQKVVGSEIHSAGLQHARRRLGDHAEFVQMDVRKIPARGAFDLVGAFDVLEHIAEDEAVIREVYSALSEGGGFLVAVPQHPALWSRIDDVSHHVRRYCRGELERKLRHAGFEIAFSSSYAALSLPLMFGSRLLMQNRPVGRNEGSNHEFEIDPLLNTSLRWLLNAEVSLTLRGFQWPVGGSRVVVARKPVGG